MENKIQDIQVKEVKEPKNIKVYEVSFLQNGKRIKKEVAKSKDVVKILLYHEEKDAFVLVKQFRPIVYINHPQYAFRYELCGGREDKEGLSSEEVAKEEVLEECGYKIDKLEKITTLTTSGRMTLYFGIVNESMRVSQGGGVDYEMID
ncbi:MAG: NUDIX hydrolase, partial [Epsilonproteobacteria bacterium]|nr:NUDIX hydrolase [Campylobacterota bacterium]